ncbi:MAG: ribosome biogenesis GTPase Der [Acidobacteriota bacterium]|nr:MAG: ribosome biogenesis GTPase Der [Acidobacteriota bacterium]
MPTSSGQQRTASAPRVAIVGRPNVGKSTLFNRLVGRREAIVLDRPGVTRDRLERLVRWRGIAVQLEDTGGLVPRAEEQLLQAVTQQALRAVSEADVVILVIDGRAGVTPLDEAIAEQLRGAGARVVIAVNKLDTAKLDDLAAEGWRLGLGEPLPVSAEHGLGIDTLLDAVLDRLPSGNTEAGAEGEASTAGQMQDPDQELLIAIVGRPNVGKSSLVNRLARSERVTVSPTPGTTRDAVDVLLERDGRRYRLVDTAGLRRASRAESRDESIGMMLTRRRLERSHVAVLVVDATMGLTSQDVGIAGEISRSGRPLVLALNKWDLVEDPEQRVKQLEETVRRRLAFARYAPRLIISAAQGRRVERVLEVCREVVAAANVRLGTADLNRFLQSAVAERAARGGTGPKMFYITQIGVLPPRFVVFCRDPRSVTGSYKRYLENRLRETFTLGPTPIVIEFRAPPRRG